MRPPDDFAYADCDEFMASPEWPTLQGWLADICEKIGLKGQHNVLGLFEPFESGVAWTSARTSARWLCINLWRWRIVDLVSPAMFEILVHECAHIKTNSMLRKPGHRRYRARPLNRGTHDATFQMVHRWVRRRVGLPPLDPEADPRVGPGLEGVTLRPRLPWPLPGAQAAATAALEPASRPQTQEPPPPPPHGPCSRRQALAIVAGMARFWPCYLAAQAA